MKNAFLFLAVSLVTITARAETLEDFSGNYTLVFENREILGKDVEPRPCRQFVSFHRSAFDDRAYMYLLDEYNQSRTTMWQALFQLGHRQIDDKTFIETTLSGNALTSQLFERTFFKPSGRLTSAVYLALLKDLAFPPHSADLYLERSEEAQISSACYYVREQD